MSLCPVCESDHTECGNPACVAEPAKPSKTLINSARIARLKLDDALNAIDNDLSKLDPMKVSDALEATSDALHRIIMALDQMAEKD